MDTFLVEYLRSGKAWVLVGSGPSNEMGYPTWKDLAFEAKSLAAVESPGCDLRIAQRALSVGDFPTVFREVLNIVGLPRLRQHLADTMRPSGVSRIYELLARWPVRVYLTTNYDNEIANHLGALGEAYIPYTNSEDHLSHLLPDLDGAIIKLHGDLSSDIGLILTTDHYDQITRSPDWLYWRTKMTSVFQMNRVVVIGHSLTDSNIRHVLEAAKNGSGVIQPVCWVAPDVRPEVAKQYLRDYRIRVVSYDNRDGSHRNLARLMENVTDFVPPRPAIRIQQQIAELSKSDLGPDAAAPGFYVFNKLAVQAEFDSKRVDIVCAAIQAVLPELASMGEFSFGKALVLAGWPKELPIPINLEQVVCRRLGDQRILTQVTPESFVVSDGAATAADENRKQFQHMRDRFKTAIQLRLKRTFPSLSPSDVGDIASDVEAAMVGYFREGGLTLSTALFASDPGRSALPTSMLKFITEASARYDDLLRRQAFCKASVDTFVRSEAAEREYIGRIAQGFFSFHALGVFGDAAMERLEHAKDTVWLIDSDAQIPALALGAPIGSAFRDCFSRLRKAGIRLFTTRRLFDETREHLWFAEKLIEECGVLSPMIIAAATGQAPYRKSNQFLQGFIRWQQAGHPADWGAYLFSTFGRRQPSVSDVEAALGQIGIEVVDFADWPGFESSYYVLRDTYSRKIAELREAKSMQSGKEELIADIFKKTDPEAEAFIVTTNERSGHFHMISNLGDRSPAWFISHTSILNLIEGGPRVTWQPEGFLAFASTIGTVSSEEAANQAFETLLWGLAQSGITLLDETAIVSVFGGVIDQARISIVEQRQLYEESLARKYGESVESVMSRISPADTPLAVIQLSTEMTQKETEKRERAEQRTVEALKRAERAESELEKVKTFKRKWESKRNSGKKRKGISKTRKNK